MICQHLKSINASQISLISKEFELLKENSKAAINVDYRLSYNNEYTTRIHNEMNAISSLLISIQSCYDRTCHLLQLSSSSNVRRSSLSKSPSSMELSIDLEAIEKSIENLPAQVSEIADGLQRIHKISKIISERARNYHTSFTRITSFFRSLELHGRKLRQTVIDVEKAEIKFEQLQSQVAATLEEINALVVWYSNFDTSYDELIFEIVRRHKELERQQQIVDGYIRNLQMFWQSCFFFLFRNSPFSQSIKKNRRRKTQGALPQLLRALPSSQPLSCHQRADSHFPNSSSVLFHSPSEALFCGEALHTGSGEGTARQMMFFLG